jgi:nucleolar protein 56
VLFESASGYGLFEVVEADEIAALKGEVQASVTDLSRFSKIVKLKAFAVRWALPLLGEARHSAARC